MFVDCLTSAGSWGRNFVGNWFVTLQCKIIYYLVKHYWGTLIPRKRDNPRNPQILNPQEQWWLHSNKYFELWYTRTKRSNFGKRGRERERERERKKERVSEWERERQGRWRKRPFFSGISSVTRSILFSFFFNALLSTAAYNTTSGWSAISASSTKHSSKNHVAYIRTSS